MFNNNENKKVDTYLKNNGYSPLKNSNGYGNGNNTIKPSDTNRSWITDSGKKYSSYSDLKKGTK